VKGQLASTQLTLGINFTKKRALALPNAPPPTPSNERGPSAKGHIQKSMSLKYEPASEPLHIYAKKMGSRPPQMTAALPPKVISLFFFPLVTAPRRSLSLKLSDTKVYEPQIRARLGTASHFCEVVLKLRAVPSCADLVQLSIERSPSTPSSDRGPSAKGHIQKSMSLKYEPASEPLHISVKQMGSRPPRMTAALPPKV